MKRNLLSLILMALLSTSALAACSKDKKDESAQAPSAAPASAAAAGPEETEEEEASPDEPEEAPSASGGAGATKGAESADSKGGSAPATGATKSATKLAPTKSAGDKPTSEPAGYSGDSPCKTTNFRFSAVKSACSKGGQPAAKQLMKQVVSKAKAAGENMKCTTCHSSVKTYALKSTAVRELKQWL